MGSGIKDDHLTWTFEVLRGPLHALAVGEGGHVGVALHTALLVTTPHTGRLGAVLTRRVHLAGRLTLGPIPALVTHVRHRGELVTVCKVIGHGHKMFSKISHGKFSY